MARVLFYGENMKEYAKTFYSSQAWKNCREAYKSKVHGLCEECLAHGRIVPGIEVHHKVFITPENINDPNITLNDNNLILLCKNCHASMHYKVKRYRITPTGEVIIK